MKFNKVYGSNIYFRVVQLLVTSIPLLFVTINIATSKRDELNMKGFALFFLLYFCFAYMYWKFNVFDWSIYSSKNEIKLKNITSQVVYNKTQELQVEKIPILSLVAKIYRLRIKEGKYYFKVIKGYSFFNRVFNQDNILKEVNQKLNSL